MKSNQKLWLFLLLASFCAEAQNSKFPDDVLRDIRIHGETPAFYWSDVESLVPTDYQQIEVEGTVCESWKGDWDRELCDASGCATQRAENANLALDLHEEEYKKLGTMIYLDDEEQSYKAKGLRFRAKAELKRNKNKPYQFELEAKLASPKTPDADLKAIQANSDQRRAELGGKLELNVTPEHQRYRQIGDFSDERTLSIHVKSPVRAMIAQNILSIPDLAPFTEEFDSPGVVLGFLQSYVNKHAGSWVGSSSLKGHGKVMYKTWEWEEYHQGEVIKLQVNRWDPLVSGVNKRPVYKISYKLRARNTLSPKILVETLDWFLKERSEDELFLCEDFVHMTDYILEGAQPKMLAELKE